MNWIRLVGDDCLSFFHHQVAETFQIQGDICFGLVMTLNVCSRALV